MASSAVLPDIRQISMLIPLRFGASSGRSEYGASSHAPREPNAPSIYSLIARTVR